MSATELQRILNALSFPALVIDRTERVIAANTDACTLIGQDVTGRNYVAMLRQPALLDAIEDCLVDKVSRRARYLSNDGVQDRTYEVTARFSEGLGAYTAGAVVLTFHDQSDLEHSGQVRRDFVANVSHELRTPLTSLMGFIETLRGPARDDPEAAQRFLDIMQGEAERMNRLVGDLMSLNRVEGDERVRPTHRIELVAILESVSRTLTPLAQEASVFIEMEIAVEAVEVIGDQDQLIQVFTNLAENAIKYGGGGGRVTFRLSAPQREAVLRAQGVRVQVVDYGAGIDPVHLPRITERFYRADDHRSRALGGTGLGLAIVKHIINRHRGRLRVESELGQGATFTVILPVAD